MNQFSDALPSQISLTLILLGEIRYELLPPTPAGGGGQKQEEEEREKKKKKKEEAYQWLSIA